MRLHLKRVTLTLLPVALLYVTVSLFISEQQHMIESDSPEQQQRSANVAQPSKRGWQIGLSSLWGASGVVVTAAAEYGSELMPNELNQYDDRIIKQMQFIPKSYKNNNQPVTPGAAAGAGGGGGGGGGGVTSTRKRLKIIYSPGGIGETPSGRRKFLRDECPVDRCLLTADSEYFKKAHVLLYQNDFYMSYPRLPNQIWVMWLLESPFHTGELTSIKDYVNWTATYRSDSTIVTPYERFVHYDNFTTLPSKPIRNFAKGKHKKVAWFVSNCASNNMRMEYAAEIAKYIDVDIYGACGTHVCSRSQRNECDDVLRKQYKFYLAFENSNCVHYITEKFYWNALFVDVLPIVMGARKQDYAAVAPPNSYIHVEDFTSAAELAQYLIKLDRNDDLYNQYFRWKDTGYFLNTKFWCRLCAMAHGVDDFDAPHWYRNVESWWRNNETCVRDRWDDPNSRVINWQDYVF